jgi:hypothetical protein
MSGYRTGALWPQIAALALSLIFASVGSSAAADLQLLPTQLSENLPAGTVAVLLAPSFAQFADDTQSIVGLFDEEAAARADLRELVESKMPGIWSVVDEHGPVVLAMALAPGGPGAPSFTVIAQLVNADMGANDVVAAVEMASIRVDDGFVTLSSDPNYSPSPERVAILDDMPTGDISVRIDLEAVVQTFGPMLEAIVGMGLAGAVADSTNGFDMDSDQQGTAIDVLGKFLDSAKTFDLAVDYNGDELKIHSRFGTLEGSVLSPGPQPEFGGALELARLLPQEHSFFHASAINLESILELYGQALEVLSAIATSELPEEVGGLYSELMTELFDHLELFSSPYAGSVGFRDGSPEITTVIRNERAGAEMKSLLDFFEGLSSRTDMVNMTRSAAEIPGGWDAERVEVELNFSGLMDPEDAESAIVMGVIQALIPSFYVAHRDDLGLWMATSDRVRFLDLAARVDQDAWPKIPPALEDALQWSGEGTQSLSTIEARSFLNSIFDLVRGFIEIPLGHAPPARVDFALKIDAAGYGGELRMNLKDAAALIQELMETFQHFDSDDEIEADEPEEASLLPAPGGRPSDSLTRKEAADMAADLRPAIEEMRGHFFAQNVDVAVVSDEEAREYFLRRLTEMLPDDMLDGYEEAYRDLGLIEAKQSLLDEFLSLLEEQAGGFYDPEEKAFFMLDDMPRSSAPIIMVHELTHALDDQVYGLQESYDAVINNNDQLNARGCVTEGSGMITMTHWLTKAVLSGRVDAGAISELGESQAGQAERLRAAPAVLANSLIAPYILGQRFLGRGNMMAAIGAVPSEDIDAAFHDPPLSMEQVLHPEKYWDESLYDAPRELSLPDLSRDIGSDWQRLYEGVLGELDLASLTGMRLSPDDPSAMLSVDFSTPAAHGWDGDRFYVHRRDGRSVTVIAIVFDSPEDADEFVAAVHLPPGSAVAIDDDRVAMVCGEFDADANDLAQRALTGMRVED